ncbi:unnamed protein product, partial [Ascophyllum nodosum]
MLMQRRRRRHCELCRKNRHDWQPLEMRKHGELGNSS